MYHVVPHLHKVAPHSLCLHSGHVCTTLHRTSTACILVPFEMSSLVGSMARTRAAASQRVSSRRTLGAQLPRSAHAQCGHIRSQNCTSNRPAQHIKNSATSLPGETNSGVHDTNYLQDGDGKCPRESGSIKRAAHQGGVKVWNGSGVRHKLSKNDRVTVRRRQRLRDGLRHNATVKVRHVPEQRQEVHSRGGELR